MVKFTPGPIAEPRPLEPLTFRGIRAVTIPARRCVTIDPVIPLATDALPLVALATAIVPGSDNLLAYGYDPVGGAAGSEGTFFKYFLEGNPPIAYPGNPGEPVWLARSDPDDGTIISGFTPPVESDAYPQMVGKWIEEDITTAAIIFDFRPWFSLPPLADGEMYQGSVDGVIKAVASGATGGLINTVTGPTLIVAAAGIITPTHTVHRIDTDGPASRDLNTISPVNAAITDSLILRAVDSARDIVFRNLTGNILTRNGSSQTLVNNTMRAKLKFDDSVWLMNRYDG